MKRAQWLAVAVAVIGAVVLAAVLFMRPHTAASSSADAAATGGPEQNSAASAAPNPAGPSAPAAADPPVAAMPSAGAGPATTDAGGSASSTPSAPPAPTRGGTAAASAAANTGGRDRQGALPDVADILAGVDLTIPEERARVAELIKEQEETRWSLVRDKARALGIPEMVKKADGGVMEIFDFDGDEPVYRTTFNHNAAISSGANLLRGGGFGNLTGGGLTVGVWDGGSVRPMHQEFAEGQVVLRNAYRPFDDHATHVAATVAALGFQPDALGMAPRASIDSYYWHNDHGEMTLAGAALASGETGRIPVSNHSYGIGFMPRSAGHYERLARGNDAVAYGLPYFLQFWAAGNAQQRGAVAPLGYYTITHYQLAKNIVTVGAVNDAVDASGQRDVSLATMSTFSSWGPVNDGRIKPDLVANGVGLYSAIDFSDQSYATYSGTSMASPSAAGTAALLVELYQREFGGQLPLASLLKAVLIHTADDSGRPGPDYQFGWGLINGPRAGELIKEHKTSPRFFAGTVMTEERQWTHTFQRVGTGPVRATLVWTDPPGEVRLPTSREPNLVHNLDLKIVGPDGTEHLPFVMPFVGNWSPSSLTLPATRGKNNTDNVEQVDLPAAAEGTYVLVVTADGPMTAAQDFSVVLTGAGPPVNPRPIVNLQKPQSGDWFLPGKKIAMAATATDRNVNGSVGTVKRVEFLADGEVLAADEAAPYEFEWAPPPGTYTLEARAFDGEDSEGYSSPAVIEVREPRPGEVHPAFEPPVADGAVLALAEDNEGRIYIGGLFTLLNASIPAQRLARLRPNGSVDTAGFVLDAGPNDRVRALQYSQTDRALYVAGDFTKVGAAGRPVLARLHLGREGKRDGTLDESFAPVIASSHPLIKPSIRAVLIEPGPDGKIVIGGLFDRVNGLERRHLARLNRDGTLDESFNPAPNGAVWTLARQADGKILVGGEFTALGVSAWNRLARIHPDGVPDTTLVLGTGQQTGFNGPVQALAIDAAGKIYAGGAFTAYRGHPYHFNLVKMERDGALAGYFNFEPGLNGSVHDIHLPGNGKILASGAFTAAANNLLGMRPAVVGRVVLFKDDGTLDAEFNTGGAGADGTVHRSLLLSNGHFLLAGAFSQFNGVPRARLAMIAGPTPPAEDAPPATLVSVLRAESAAGEAIDLAWGSSGRSAGLTYQLQSELPLGLRFDPTTGRLSGVPLEAGHFQLRVAAVGSDGGSIESLLELVVAESAVSYEQWRDAWFAAGETSASEPEAVNNPAGLSNLEVYAFSGGDPRTASVNLLPRAEVVETSRGRQVGWSASRYALANYGGVTNVIFRPMVASDPGGPWIDFDGTAVSSQTGRVRFQARAEAPHARRFFRVELQRP